MLAATSLMPQRRKKLLDPSEIWMTSQKGVVDHFSMLLHSVRQNDKGSLDRFNHDFCTYVSFLNRSGVDVNDPQLNSVLRSFPVYVFPDIEGSDSLSVCSFFGITRSRPIIPMSKKDVAFPLLCVAAGLTACQFRPILLRPVFIKTSPVFQLENEFRIACVGNLGTNDIHHRRTLRAIKTLNPTAVIHLGNIFPSGLAQGCKKFWEIYEEVFGPNAENKTPLWAIPGNQEYISGLYGFREELLDKRRLGNEGCQMNSFFALRNKFVQIIGMDTGRYGRHYDAIPGLIPDDSSDGSLTRLDQEEGAWLLTRMAEWPATILLSHHQYFSHTWSAHNPNFKLRIQLGAEIHKVKLWLWGHERQFYAYKSPTPGEEGDYIYGGLMKGRCIGHGALPNLVAEGSYDPGIPKKSGWFDCAVTNEPRGNGDELPLLDPEWCPPETSPDEVTGDAVYNCGFAMLEMNAKGRLTAKYYELPWGSDNYSQSQERFHEHLLPEATKFSKS